MTSPDLSAASLDAPIGAARFLEPDPLEAWRTVLVCPLDKRPLGAFPGDGRCDQCGFAPGQWRCGGRLVPDWRAADRAQTLQLEVRLPVRPLEPREVASRYFIAERAHFPHLSRAEIGRRYGTKLNKGLQYYCHEALARFGPDAPVLDLGCGSGGNRAYLRDLGFRRILTVDWESTGADLLVDAHRLPFADGAFQVVLSTAVFEHLYHPFLGMKEVSRVLGREGYFLGGASFWEAWHAHSHFHFTPDGWHCLLTQAGLSLEDLWAGWGVVPAAMGHVFGAPLPRPVRSGLRRAGFALQSGVEGAVRLLRGRTGVYRFRLLASGSYQVCARKPASAGTSAAVPT
jgi:SAM-dependent methyltransferase